MRSKGTTLGCFSPPVMIATFAIEIILAIYTIYRYKLDKLGRLIVATIFFLAIFQLAEYNVCENSAHGITFSRLGYFAITLLPPLGVHIVSEISKRVPKAVVVLAYASAAVFAATFTLSSTAFQSYACSGNYAIFSLVPRLGGVYFAYYYFWLVYAIGSAMYFSATASIKQRKALLLHAGGMLMFLVPTGIVNAVNPSTISGIPSVMCGFAVLFAFMLAIGVAPTMLKEKDR